MYQIDQKSSSAAGLAWTNPAQFEEAVWTAWMDLFITEQEAIDAIREYRQEVEKSGLRHTSRAIGGQE